MSKVLTLNYKKLTCHKDRAMLRVTEYFAKSLMVTQDHSKLHSSERRKSLLAFH